MNTRALTSPQPMHRPCPSHASAKRSIGPHLGNLFKCPFSNTHIYNENIERFSIACAFCYNKQR